MSDAETRPYRLRTHAADLTVGDVMSADILGCGPGTSIAEAARLMSAARRSSIVIHEDDRVLGIWTERDALAGHFDRAGADRVPIRDVMSSPVFTLPVRTSIGEAAAQFKQRNIRHFVVVDLRDRPVGLISQSDVVMSHGVEWFMRLQPVASVLTEPPPLIAPDEPLAGATERMREERRDAVVVDTGEGDFAILTERDILRHIAEGGAATRCLDIATRPMQTVSADDSLFQARNLMIRGSFRHLGVTSGNGELSGLIGFREIMLTIEHGYIEELELALRERDAELRASEERYRALVEASPDAIAVHRDHRILFINPAGATLLGANGPAQVLGTSFDRYLERYGSEDIGDRLALLEREIRSEPTEERFVRLDGQAVDVELRVMPITYNGEQAWQVVMSDITRRKQVEAELRRLASTDQLTGVNNRPHFEQHLDHELREAERYGQPLSLIMFDLNGFKRINDSLGHDAGDAALQSVSAAVASKLRDTDLFARWGGDEFMILLPRTEPDGAWHLCNKLAAALEANQASDMGPVGAAFAVTEYRPGESRRSLLKRLDTGVYQAKGEARDRLNGLTRV